MELFYNKDIDKKTVEFQLDGIENNHIIKVLRKKNDIKIYGKPQILSLIHI